MRVSMEGEGEDKESVPSAGSTVKNILRVSSIEQPYALALYKLYNIWSVFEPVLFRKVAAGHAMQSKQHLCCPVMSFLCP